MNYKIGDNLIIRGGFGMEPPQRITVTGIGEKHGQLAFDYFDSDKNERWCYAWQVICRCDKSSVILPVHPEYVALIQAGTKKYEYRKHDFKRNVTRAFLYSTAPVCMVTGDVIIAGVIEGTPKEVWRKTKDFSGLPEDNFVKYYKDCEKAVAYSLGACKTFAAPIPLSVFGIDFIPQSFVYLN